MFSDVSGRTALVTGGASGIGAAVACRLASQGAVVTIADVADAAGHAVAEEIAGIFHHLDVAEGLSSAPGRWYLAERVAGAEWVAWGDYAGTYQWNPPFS